MGRAVAGLILKLQAHEQILVNGVVMQNGARRARLLIKTPGARILRQRDAMHPDEADTPVKRACYLAQLVVAGERGAEEAAAPLRRDLAVLAEALDGVAGVSALAEARQALEADNFYGVMRALRSLIPLEAELLALDGGAAG